MKVFVLVVLSLATFASVYGQDAEPKLIAARPTPKPTPKPAECSFCSVEVDPNPNCICSSSTRLRRKYACGPACDALGYCCESSSCPECGSGVTPSGDPGCTCEAPAFSRLVRYACGPACDAAGYCCDRLVTIDPDLNTRPTKPTTNDVTRRRRMKCVNLKHWST